VEKGTALVDQVGTTMTEVVSNISRVTDIMGGISAGSSEQALGVAQVSEAINSLDQTTQQNAALVEQMTAAADGLKMQAGDLMRSGSVSKRAPGRDAFVDRSDAAPVSRPIVPLQTRRVPALPPPNPCPTERRP
jgi:methyl-accepting chemotaxis protein